MKRIFDNTRQQAVIILERMIKKSGLSQNRFAEEILGIKSVNVTRARQSGKIPETWFEAVEKKLGLTKEELCRPPQQIRASFTYDLPGSPPDEDDTATPPIEPGSVEIDQDEPSLDKMVQMTTTVLESNTVYRAALASNIRAFYQAVTGEEEMEYLRGQVERMSQDIAEMKELMQAMANHHPPEKNRPATIIRIDFQDNYRSG